jgi:RNA polymerase sigma factor FliA
MSPTDDREREALIASGMKYARHLATKLSQELPPSVPLDDLLSAAHLGLVDAARRFDPERGAQFTTFAHYRIRGAILDHVRDASASQPHYRARVAAESALDALVEARLGSTVNTLERDDAASVLADLLGEMAVTCTLTEIAEETRPEVPPDPESVATSIERRRRLDEALDTMPEREGTLLRAVYFQQQTIEQAGAAMGLSKSWASRLHARAVTSLKARLGALEDDL